MRFTPRSSSGTTRRCAASRSSSGAADPARRGVCRQLRGAQIRRPVGPAQRDGQPALPQGHFRAAPHGALPGGIAAHHEDRRRNRGGGRADVHRRGLPGFVGPLPGGGRGRRPAQIPAAGAAVKAAHPLGAAIDGHHRDCRQQTAGQDCQRPPEAGRADTHCRGGARSSSCARCRCAPSTAWAR